MKIEILAGGNIEKAFKELDVEFATKYSGDQYKVCEIDKKDMKRMEDYEGEYGQHMGNGISFKPDILCMADLFRYDFFKIHYVYHRKRSCLRRRTLMDGGRSPG